MDYMQCDPVWLDAEHTQIEMTINGERVVINATPGLIHYDGIVAAGVPIGPYVPPPPEAPSDIFIVQMQYKAKVTTTGVIDPTNGFIIWNTTAQTDARKLAVSARSADNVDYGGVFRASIIPRHVISLQYVNNAGQLQQFTIDMVTDKGTWFVLDVTPKSAWGGKFAGNNPIFVALSLRGATPPPVVPAQLMTPLDMGQTISERLGGE